MAELCINHTTLLPVLGELQTQNVDALIHPTNTHLWFAPGVSEKIKMSGGRALESQAMQLGPIEVGQAVIGEPGRLPCKYLIHTAAWGQDMMTDKFKVSKAVLAALDAARGKGCLSVALPPVGAGVGGFSLLAAIETTFLAIVEHCMTPTTLTQIRLLVNSASEIKILENMITAANHADPNSGHSLL